VTAPPNRHLAAGWLIALAIVCGLALSQLLGRTAPPTAQNVELEWLERPRPVAAFTLASAQGEITEAALQGHWQLLALGFTHCPDLCPTTLAQLDALRATMTDAPVRVIFVSVDPERDSPAQLAAYVGFFGADFIGVTGEEDQLQRLAHSLGMDFRHDDPSDSPGENPNDNSNNNPPISHSPTIAVIGPDGLLHGRLRPGFDTQRAARELTARMRGPA
jgi:protein SCO1/2